VVLLPGVGEVGGHDCGYGGGCVCGCECVYILTGVWDRQEACGCEGEPLRGISPGMIDARSGAADSHRHRVPGVFLAPGGLNAVTLRTENNGRDAETTWLMVGTVRGGGWVREESLRTDESRVQRSAPVVPVRIIFYIYIHITWCR